MAVTITAENLARAIRVPVPLEEPDTGIVNRLLSVATQLVTEYAPNAPDAIHDEAVVRVAGYLYDQPQAGMGQRFTSALTNSGTFGLLLPWRPVRVHTLNEG